MQENWKLIRPRLRCSPMVLSVAIAIQAEFLLERGTNQLPQIFSACERIANELSAQNRTGSNRVRFAIDEDNQIVKAYTNSDDLHNGKKPIFTIEQAVCTCAMECFEAANCKHNLNQVKIKAL